MLDIHTYPIHISNDIQGLVHITTRPSESQWECLSVPLGHWGNSFFSFWARNTPIRDRCRVVPPHEKTCTSPFWGAGGSACRAPIKEGMCWTSSAFVIEQTLHL